MHMSDVIKQKSYEHIVFVLRRHWITFIPIAFLFIILSLAPVIVYVLIGNLFPDILFSSTIQPLAILFGSAFYLSLYLFFYGHFIDFYLDLWVVTNDIIVDIEQHNLFHRIITELDLFRIQDVTTHVKGVFPTLFGYGNVDIKTASNNSHIVFYNVKHPNHIREQLIRLADEDRKFHQGQE
ncbi:MAG: PH domain-containing protein [Candidatus Magasanikbacteria bacterium]|nr:PH domain-containing protein [Candidatus Magasanikbacteria bacterium]